MYINLLIVEEAKAIVGWEGIRHIIRMEDHHRTEAQTDPSESKTVLDTLSDDDLIVLKVCCLSIT